MFKKLAPIIGLPIEDEEEEPEESKCITFIPFKGPKSIDDYFTSTGTIKLYLNDYDIENQRIIELDNSNATLDLLIEILEKIDK